MNHPLPACRLGTCARAPDYALSPNLYTMCTRTRMHICTRTLTLARTSQWTLLPHFIQFNCPQFLRQCTSISPVLLAIPLHNTGALNSLGRPTKEPPSHARAPPPSHKTTPPCLPLHTTRSLTVVSVAPEDEQLVVGRREAVTRSGRRR